MKTVILSVSEESVILKEESLAMGKRVRASRGIGNEPDRRRWRMQGGRSWCCGRKNQGIVQRTRRFFRAPQTDVDNTKSEYQFIREADTLNGCCTKQKIACKAKAKQGSWDAETLFSRTIGVRVYVEFGKKR